MDYQTARAIRQLLQHTRYYTFIGRQVAVQYTGFVGGVVRHDTQAAGGRCPECHDFCCGDCQYEHDNWVSPAALARLAASRIRQPQLLDAQCPECGDDHQYQTIYGHMLCDACGYHQCDDAPRRALTDAEGVQVLRQCGVR